MLYYEVKKKRLCSLIQELASATNNSQSLIDLTFIFSTHRGKSLP
uniref:Uncharacterized protein n=1 Tax=Rhizophora mucronata TaxID=61149 RepID=A0A2P2QV50_RHIMU